MTSSSRKPFSSRLGQPSAGRLDAIGRSLSKSYSFHIVSQPLQEPEPGDGSLKVESVPIDFQLKTKIRISSPKPLDWLLNQDATTMSRSLDLFTSRQLPSCSSRINDALDAAAVFRASLFSWVHPDASIEESSAERRAQWEQSFHSIYYSFRQGFADYFYVLGAKFAVLFANGIAIITRSTSELRKELEAHNIQFSMPLRKSRDEEQRLIVDVTEESALLFQGRRALHQLFGYLINKKFLGDVPVIISHTPFINAAVKSATPVFNQMTSSAGKGPDGSKLTQTHVVEFTGILLPLQTGTIVDILRQRAKGEITMQVWSEPLTAALDRIGDRDLADIACKHGFIALVDFAKKYLESDATLSIRTMRFAETASGQITVEIEPTSKPSSLSRAPSSTKLLV